MTQVARRPQQAANVGVSPTNAQKLIYIASKLGLGGIKDMQGASFNIFDTVLLSAGTGRQVLPFFANTSNKSRTFSNLQQGTLQAGETMLLEELSFVLLTLSGTDLTSDATTITNAQPLTMAPAATLANKFGTTLGLLNITIANQRVVKDYNTYEQDPAFNPRTTGIASFDTSVATNVRMGESKIFLESGPVLPPNQKINVTLEISATGAVLANSAIMCIGGRFGSIFSGKTTL